MTVIGMLLLVSYLALYFGVFGLFYRWSAGYSLLSRIFLVPAAYVILEFVRERVFGGFGWASLSHTMAHNTLLIQLADVTGAAGVSFLIVMVNVVFKEHFVRWQEQRRSDAALWSAALVTGVVVLGVLAYGLSCLSAGPRAVIRAGVVQANISLAEAWDPVQKPSTVERHLELSRRILPGRPDLIVWPETSFPQFIWQYPGLWDRVRDLARGAAVPLMVGAVTREGKDYFNSAILVGRDGKEGLRYDKTHLVLFGEFIPFRRAFPFLAGLIGIDDFTPGRADRLFSFLPGAPFSVLICFEDTLPWLARRAVDQGALFLVNMTNDAWFAASPGAAMHFDNAVFRAVENRRSLVRSTNTGQSGLIDMYGRRSYLGEGRLLEPGAGVFEVPLDNRMTFYTKYGDVFTGACFLGILFFIFVGRKKRPTGMQGVEYAGCQKDPDH